jgi:isopentenyl phosphate kinase
LVIAKKEEMGETSASRCSCSSDRSIAIQIHMSRLFNTIRDASTSNASIFIQIHTGGSFDFVRNEIYAAEEGGDQHDSAVLKRDLLMSAISSEWRESMRGTEGVVLFIARLKTRRHCISPVHL